MYERIDDPARRVIQLANQEAQHLGHDYIGTEHILLGLVKLGSGVAADVLKNLDIDLRTIRREVEKIVQGEPDELTLGKLLQTPRAKKVVEYAIEEARTLNHDYVGTEHLLLGLLREQEGVAAQVLMNLGLKLEDIREKVLNALGCPAPPVGLQGLATQELPAELRQAVLELHSQIELLDQQKEAAVAAEDFERAADLRDQADKLKDEKKPIILDWRKRHSPDPSWLSWNGGAVTTLARRIVGERRWEDLPMLADELAKAGCGDREMLSHCREGGEHDRGCWVVALLLGMN
jgi:ATP-dependent Clp protease ATP-binding subunit ClpA